MRVESITTTVYTFTKLEVDYLCRMGVWDLINNRLKDNERIEVE